MINLMSFIFHKFATLLGDILDQTFLLAYEGNVNVYATTRVVIVFFFLCAVAVELESMFSNRRKK